MTTWVWILGGLYGGALAIIAASSYLSTEDEDDYILAGSNVGVWVGLLTYAATLFSTFTLMGMPDFFRMHGVGAWIFLAVSDGAMVFLMVWFGYHLRKRAREEGFRGTGGLLAVCYENCWAGYVYFAGAFLFLIPYVAIQIWGLAVFLEAVFPGALPHWAWSTLIVVAMLIYSELGGLRAIMYSDVLQGLTLLLVTWIVAIGCVSYFGGVGGLFNEIATVKPDLLSTPGPQGLFTNQWLFASLIAIILLPVTQPQLTTRMVVMKNTRAQYRMAVAVGVFAILVITPTIAIGLYGSIHYAGATAREFLAGVLLYEQADVLAATTVVGLLTAAMSTADSQIFALGTELRSLLPEGQDHVMRTTRISIVGFGVLALIFAIFSSDQIVLLARVSFAGTGILGALVLTGIFSKRPPGTEIIVASAVALLVFVLSLAGILPDRVGPIQLDLFLMVGMGIFSLLSVGIRSFVADEPVPSSKKV